jgi:lysylphosphatidylglycerol synthetase-like protein (DUF2156 family)
MANGDPEVRHPNRDLPKSRQTKSIVAFLLVLVAALVAVITIGGWDKLEGAKPVNIFFIVVYLLFAYYVSRWNRGVLPVATALSVILIIFAAVAGPAWFERDKSGFESPFLPEPLLGFLTLLLIPASLLLMFFSMRGFQQGWNIEAGSRAFLDQQEAEAQPT